MNASANDRQINGTWLQIVRRQVESLHFGVVQIVVHGNRVVQIEKTEKMRLDKTDASVFPAIKETLLDR
jgi:hypothetical protein